MIPTRSRTALTSAALVALVGVVFIHFNLPSIGVAPGLVALVVYALLPIVRNTYTGVRQVDPTVIEVATGMGMTRRQILFRVQLPLALPFIMAGLHRFAYQLDLPIRLRPAKSVLRIFSPSAEEFRGQEFSPINVLRFTR